MKNQKTQEARQRFNQKVNWLATLHPYVRVNLSYDPCWTDKTDYKGWLIPVMQKQDDLWGCWNLLMNDGKALPFTDINLNEIEILETPGFDKERVIKNFEKGE